MDPKNLSPWRRVNIMVTGVIQQHTAIVTDKKDTVGWCIIRVVGPKDSHMMGAELKCEDYIPIEYADTLLLDLLKQPGRAVGLRVHTPSVIDPKVGDYMQPRAARPNATGVIENYSDSHGLCFNVKHDDPENYGTRAGYDPDELTIIYER